jgi:hypothetical protein
MILKVIHAFLQCNKIFLLFHYEFHYCRKYFNACENPAKLKKTFRGKHSKVLPLYFY